MSKKDTPLIAFFIRHAVACVISIALPIFVAAILCLVLFAIGENFIEPSQNALAILPAMMFIAGKVGFGYTVTLLFPSAALAELLSQRFLKRSLSAEVLIAFILLAIFSLCAGVTADLIYGDHATNPFIFYSFATFTVTAIPLLIYLITLISAPKLIARAGFIFSRIRSRITRGRN